MDGPVLVCSIILFSGCQTGLIEHDRGLDRPRSNHKEEIKNGRGGGNKESERNLISGKEQP